MIRISIQNILISNAEDPQPSKNCPRANGFFPFPAEESCQKFWDCRGGKLCDQGLIVWV